MLSKYLKRHYSDFKSISKCFVAIFGITIWKSEFKGMTYFEVSFKFLKSIYKLRDSFTALRANFISVNELLPKDHSIKLCL